MTTARKPRRETNTQFLTRIMEYSRSGALMQCFILDALEKHAARVIAADPASLDTAMISGAAWHATATELKAAIAAHYAS